MFSESAQEAWHLRYGTPPPDLDQLAPFLRHRSIRHYTNEPIPEETIRALIGVAGSAASSSNLQLWSILSVQNPETRDTLAKLSGDQDQIRKAAWFFAFLADHNRLRHAANQNEINLEGFEYIEALLTSVIDAALAAERMVTAAESLGLGVCYIGSLRNDAEGVKQALNLPEGVFAPFGLCLGWPDPNYPANIKPRLGDQVVWHKESYSLTPNTEAYDQRAAAFFTSEGMDATKTWSQKSAQRMSPKYMQGRAYLAEWLHKNGMAIR